MMTNHGRIACRTLALAAVSGFIAAGTLAAEPWRVEEIGIPINAVNYENSGGVVSVAPGGQGVAFYTSYYRSTGAELVGYDTQRKTAFRKRLPSQGGYGIAAGQPAAVYVGGVSPGDLYRYEPRKDHLTTIKVAQFGVDFIWDIAVGDDAVVYCAAGYPKTRLIAYDPKADTTSDLGEMMPGQQYLRSICVDRLGKVWCGIGMTAHLVVFDPKTATKQNVLPNEYAASSSVYDLAAVGDHVLASVLFDGVLLIYDAASRKVVRTIPRPERQKSWMISAGGGADTAYLWTLPAMDLYKCNVRTGTLERLAGELGQVKFVQDDRWAHGMNDQTYFLYDLQTKQIVARQRMTEGGDGMDVFSLTTGPDGNIYGSTYINMHLFRCDAETKALTDLGKVSRWAGQVDSLSLGRDGRLYIGAYTDAVLSVYDPRQDWKPGLKADSNPREIGPVGKGQYRTKANCLGPDGKIYVGSIPSYRSAETGAFTICDPKTGAMDVRTDFVKGGTVEALAADEHYVYGAGGGEFFVYDPATGQKRLRVERPTISLAPTRGGKVVASGGGKLFLYDREANAIAAEAVNPLGDFTHMAAGPDGTVFGVNARCVARAGADGVTAEILTNEGGRFAAVDSRGRVYFARGPKLFRCSPAR